MIFAVARDKMGPRNGIGLAGGVTQTDILEQKAPNEKAKKANEWFVCYRWDARFFLNKMRVAWHVDPAESFGDGMEIEEISIPTWATIGRLDM